MHILFPKQQTSWELEVLTFKLMKLEFLAVVQSLGVLFVGTGV